MALNLIGFAVVKADADRHGLPEAEANRAAVVGGLLGSPLAAFAVGRSLVTRKLEELQSAQPSPAAPPIQLLPPRPAPTPPGGGTGAPAKPAPTIEQLCETAVTAATDVKASVGAMTTLFTDFNRKLTELAREVRKLKRQVRDTKGTRAAPGKGSKRRGGSAHEETPQAPPKPASP